MTKVFASLSDEAFADAIGQVIAESERSTESRLRVIVEGHIDALREEIGLPCIDASTRAPPSSRTLRKIYNELLPHATAIGERN